MKSIILSNVFQFLDSYGYQYDKTSTRKKKSLFSSFLVLTFAIIYETSLYMFQNKSIRTNLVFYIVKCILIIYWFIESIPSFGFIGIQMNYLFLYWNFSVIFLKKTNKRPNIKQERKCLNNKFFFVMVFILSVILFLRIFVQLNSPCQQRIILNTRTKGFKNSKISLFVPLRWLNHNDIIWGVSLGCQNESITQGRSYSQMNINISNCFFSRSLDMSGDGGVIDVSGGSYSMNVNESMFYNCVCSQYGGAIRYSSYCSNLRMVCANRCHSNGSYHFAYLATSQANTIDYLTVLNCSYTASGSYSICLHSSIQRVDNTNSSMNKANLGSLIFISSPTSFTSTHCSFSHSKANERRCIYFYSDSGTILMVYSNIVHNLSPTQGVVYVQGNGQRNLKNCVFQNNSIYLFCVYSGSLEVSHSFIDHSSPLLSISTAVLTGNNNSFVNIMTYQIQFYGSHYCNADIPLPQRTFENSPMKSLQETIRETPKDTIPRTYDEIICSYQISNNAEISVIFSFQIICLSCIQW